ncbi:hypothetical protein COCON_G00032580 [Conger conger]|uniref:Uncharacterized protein n=1 Tax=Conger conger TaxID=82655 RepID=A0A9Q1DZ16_CONCO|nr:hypothetical protein COCON_G00032580 [Conger conger]
MNKVKNSFWIRSMMMQKLVALLILLFGSSTKSEDLTGKVFTFPSDPPTAAKRREFTPVFKKFKAVGFKPFLVYPATLKVEYKGSQLTFKSPIDAENFLQTAEVNPLDAPVDTGNPYQPLDTYANALRAKPSIHSTAPTHGVSETSPAASQFMDM